VYASMPSLCASPPQCVILDRVSLLVVAVRWATVVRVGHAPGGTGCCALVVVVAGGRVRAVCRERLEVFERAEDGSARGPVGREVQRDEARVAGELAGDVQDPVAQPLGSQIWCSFSSVSSCVQTMTSRSGPRPGRADDAVLPGWRCPGRSGR
jgi:hypothetical protein